MDGSIVYSRTHTLLSKGAIVNVDFVTTTTEVGFRETNNAGNNINPFLERCHQFPSGRLNTAYARHVRQIIIISRARTINAQSTVITGRRSVAIPIVSGLVDRGGCVSAANDERPPTSCGGAIGGRREGPTSPRGLTSAPPVNAAVISPHHDRRLTIAHHGDDDGGCFSCRPPCATDNNT